MTRSYHASSVLTLLVLLILLSFVPLSTPIAISTLGDADNRHRDHLPGLPVSKNMEGRLEQIPAAPENQNGEEEELFKDVDPKTLAAVLLEALNHSHPLQVRGKDEKEQDGSEEEIKAERGKVDKEEAYQGTAARDRDGRQELEMWIASQGKERERDQEEEREKALEEEEKMTEKVTSHTTSHVVQMSTGQQPSGPDGTAESGASSQQGSSNPKQGSNQEEEQLNSEELKSLETVMKEFPRLNTKRGDDSEQQQRESRAFSSYNDVGQKGSDLALSKKKLKWQEETQKALHFPTFTGDNFIDKHMNGVYSSKATHSKSPAEQEVTAEDGSEEEEEVLSPEEEEAQAKEEQEEMLRQAAEAQRAKMEEEKLADIASDMLLRYMVKQDNGNKKYASSVSNAAEDKRSNEELDVTEEDDIDPQTIDKLIEISSKLHLPADDVVDIITDVEKKKKKDMPPEMASFLHNRPSPPSSSLLPGWQILNNKNSLSVSKQPSPAVNLLKTWFHEKKPSKPDGLQLSKPSPDYYSFWPNSEKSFKQNHWFKSPKSLWAAYPYHPYTYASYYQRKPFHDYYPFYFHTLPRPRSYYYISKPAHTINNFPGNSIDDSYTYPPKRRYHSWVQSQLRKPPSLIQQKSYFTNYHPPIYPRPFKQVSIPKVQPPSQTAASPPQLYTLGSGTEGTKNQEYFDFGKSDSSIHDDLEKYIQQILINRLQMMD